MFKGGNMSDVRSINRSGILRLLHEKNGLSRKCLSEILELTPATISKVTMDLIQEGTIEEGASLQRDGSSGRREVLLQLRRKSYCALGILIHAKYCILSAVWMDGSVVFSERISNDDFVATGSGWMYIKSITDRLLRLVEANDLEHSRILGIGVAIRGQLDRHSRIVLRDVGILNIQNYPLAELMEQYTGLKTVLMNNVQAISLAHVFESRGVDSGMQYFLCCQHGIGAAIIYGNRPADMERVEASEIGHSPLGCAQDRRCFCGQHGCLETVASPDAITRDVLEKFSRENTPVLWKLVDGNADGITLQSIMDAAEAGDCGVGAIVENALALLVRMTQTAMAICRLDKIILYGRLFISDYFMNRFMEETKKRRDPYENSCVFERSCFNCELEGKAASIIVIDRFLSNGGVIS